MVMVGVVARHRLQIVQRRGLRRIRLERFGGLVRILRGEHRGIEQRARQRPGDLPVLADQAAAHADDAAGLVAVLAVEIGRRLPCSWLSFSQR